MPDTIVTQNAQGTTTKTLKPGYKTTEFWLSLVAQGLGYVAGLGLIPTDSIWGKAAAFILAGLASLGYSISRGMAKK